jgi:tetratricopeptide (TPR) repeat protein
LIVLACGPWAWQTSQRSKLWRNEALLLVDAAAHYPEGGSAHYLRARGAAQIGDVDTAVAELRAAVATGMDNFTSVLNDPAFAPIRQQRAYREFSNWMAQQWIDRARERGADTQADHRMVGQAHLVRREYPEAIAAFERALEAVGPMDELLRGELENTRMQMLRVDPSR